MNVTFLPRKTAWILVALALGALPLALAADRDAPRIPGFVDGSAFADLAGEDSEIVEVNIRAPLLKALSRIDAEDEGFGECLRNLQSVSAYIVGLDKDTDRAERATRMVSEMEARLGRQGWERLAVVREKESRLNVLIRNNDEVIDGLVVLAVDGEEGKVVFVNIAGVIDLARIGELGKTLNVPGLDAVSESEKSGRKTKGGSSKREGEREKERKKEREKEEPEP